MRPEYLSPQISWVLAYGGYFPSIKDAEDSI
jgi:hypothetical protein